MKLLLMLVSFFVGFDLMAQPAIKFEFEEMEQAKSAALDSGKLVFVDFYAAWCGPCRAMENGVFKEQDVADFFNQNFINCKIDTDKAVGKQVASDFGVKEFPVYFFINHEGEVVHKFIGFHSSKRLLNEARKALQLSKGFVSLKNLDAHYQQGNRESSFLYHYIERKNDVEGGQPTLLEEYLNSVPESELRTEKTLAVIAENIGGVQSQGFEVLKSSLSRFHAMTETQQKAILKGLTTSKLHTFNKAVDQRNEELLEALIEAVHQTSYSLETAMIEERQFRYDFAKLTKNFKHYRIIAESEASSILNETPESLAKQSAEALSKFEQHAKERGISENSGQYKSMRESLEKSAERAVSFELIELSRGYLEMATQEADLKNALKWTAFAIKLMETPANWETYGLLLEKLGRKKDAQKAHKRAAKLHKKA